MEKYGSWKSPITAERVTKGAKRFGNPLFDHNTLYWTEQRPEEKGRTLIVTEQGDLTPAEYSVRTRVYEYGGLSFAVKEGVVYFVNNRDQSIYRQRGNLIDRITEEGVRYGDLRIVNGGIVAVAEEGKKNDLRFIDLETKKVSILTEGADFYASPTISPDGKKIAWLSWNSPNMPWDGTELWVGEFKNQTILHAHKVAGGEKESIFQPQWSELGVLHFISDKTGWWNLYADHKNLFPLEAEFGLPQWQLGMSTYGFCGDQIVCCYFQEGRWKIATLQEGKLRNLPLEGENYSQICCSSKAVAYIVDSSHAPSMLSTLDLDSLQERRISAQPKEYLDAGYLSQPEAISFPCPGGGVAHGFYYPPTNKEYQLSSSGLPPLLVNVHGGPTAQVTSAFNLSLQYWTSRGFALLNLNYRGSTGYGRAYRDALKGNWGIVDVEDCVAGADYLVKRGLADPKRLIVRGGSAGGYTTLAALSFTDTFAAGASYYGVSDLKGLVDTTHKFEERYLDQLIGPYPEKKELYRERSPLYAADKIKNPVIFLQGTEDKVVPVEQSRAIYEALQKRGIKTKLVLMEGEEHGFRQAQHIQKALEEELAFYQQVFSLY